MEALLRKLTSESLTSALSTTASTGSGCITVAPEHFAELDNQMQKYKNIIQAFRESNKGANITGMEALLEGFDDLYARLERTKTEWKKDSTSMVISCSYIDADLLFTCLGVSPDDILHIKDEVFKDVIAPIFMRSPLANSCLRDWDDRRFQEYLAMVDGGVIIPPPAPEGITSSYTGLTDAWVLSIFRSIVEQSGMMESDSSESPQLVLPGSTPRVIYCRARNPPEVANPEKEKSIRESGKVPGLDEVIIIKNGERTILSGITEYIAMVLTSDIRNSWETLEDTVTENFDKDVSAQLLIIESRNMHRGMLVDHLPSIIARCVGILNLPKFRTRSGAGSAVSFVLTNGREWFLGVVGLVSDINSKPASNTASASSSSTSTLPPTSDRGNDGTSYKIFVSPRFTCTHSSIFAKPMSSIAKSESGMSSDPGPKAEETAKRDTTSDDNIKPVRQPEYDEFLKAILIWMTSLPATLLADLSALLDVTEIADGAAHVNIEN